MQLSAESTVPAGAPPRDIVFVDLETTGGNAAYHRITEIGLVRMRDGEVVEEWSSLVNPERNIPLHIQAFTGITDEMVARAPRFAAIAAEVHAKLTGGASTRGNSTASAQAPVFAAHNARFDYSFLRHEFERAGLKFRAPVLCTVKLSRRLYPELARHNLDAVMQRHGITCAARHRALGDAQVLRDLWAILRRDVPEISLAEAARSAIGTRRLPDHLPVELADDLPDGPGVYRLYDGDNMLLSLGSCASLSRSLLDLLGAEPSDAALRERIRAVRRVDWLETGSALGAQLLEARLLKHERPLHAKSRRSREPPITLLADGAMGVRQTPIAELSAEQAAQAFGVFKSHRDARKALTDIARAHRLCLKQLGLEEGPGSCVAHSLGRCKGVCIGRELPLLHDIRLKTALVPLKLKAWPFDGRIALEDSRGEYLVLEQWQYIGMARSDSELAALAVVAASAGFDLDTYRILARYFAKRPDTRWRVLTASARSTGAAAGLAETENS